VANERVRGNCKHRRADEQQLRRRHSRRRILLEVLEELRASLVRVDAADVDHERTVDAELLAEPGGIHRGRDHRPDADDHPGDAAVRRERLNHGALLERVVHDGPDSAEDRPEHRDAQRRITLGGGHEHRSPGRRAHAVKRLVIARAEEHQVIELGCAAADALDERGRPRSFAVEPQQLVAHRMFFVEHAGRPPRKVPLIPLVHDRESLDIDAVHAVRTRRQLVAPRHIVPCAGRQDRDRGVAREVLRNVPRVQLGAAADVGAVSLHDDAQLH
jgi:hypothetical protein